MGFIARRVLLGVIMVVLVMGLGVQVASAAGTAAWSVYGVAEPSQFLPNDAAACAASLPVCDRYEVLVRNVGDAPSSGPVTVTDTLPPGMTTRRTPKTGFFIGDLFGEEEAGEWECTSGAGNSTVTCTLEGSVPVGVSAPYIT